MEIHSTTIYILYMVVHKLHNRILVSFSLSFSLSLPLPPSLLCSSLPVFQTYAHRPHPQYTQCPAGDGGSEGLEECGVMALSPKGYT